MAIEALNLLRNMKVKYKVLLIFVLLLLLVVDLGALNITSVYDIRNDTQHISDELIPRLIQTDEIKDSLNLSLLSAYDYVQSGNSESKQQYEEHLQRAVAAEVDLFLSSTSEADLEFTTSFQAHINNLNDALSDLIDAYERGADSDVIQQQLTIVSTYRDSFASFLNDEVKLKVQEESVLEIQQTNKQVTQTIINVAVVGLIAVIGLILLYSFINTSVTKPVQQLTEAAEDIGKGKFRIVDIQSKDEMGLFADTFNTMTQRVKASQESLEIELKKTKKLDHQKTEFLAIAAHQLRTPMSGIKWLVNMVIDGDLGKISKEATEQLGKGMENINRMIGLINNLLDVTQLETEQLKYQLKAYDLVELSESVLNEFDHNAKNNKVKLSIKKPSKALPMVKVDSDKIKLALRNLIDNAIKYTKATGKVELSFSNDANSCSVIVSDTGYGIPFDEQDRVFSKFYRGSNIQTVQADGSGLGLFIVHEVIIQHHGDVTFESEVGKGTTFTIELPLADKELIAITKAETATNS